MRRTRWTRLSTVLTTCVIGFAAACTPQTPRSAATEPQAASARLAETYARLPLHFEENRGQAGASARFIARADGGRVLLGADGLHFAVDGHPVRLSFAGGAAAPSIEALDRLPGRVNYYVGPEPRAWRTDIPVFGRVRYTDVYPGIDVVVYGNQRQLEYDFVVAPGADPGAIRIRIDGADAVTIDAAGDVTIRRGARTIVQRTPVVYQERDGRRDLVTARYRLAAAHELVVDVGAYDRGRALVIDPIVVYSARVGLGTASAIAVDGAGHAYFGGANTGAFNNEYPMVNAAFPRRMSGLAEIFVTRLSPDGATLIYSTYIGSANQDFLNGIATDGAGNAYITGGTRSSSYPTTVGSFQPTVAGRTEDSVVPFVTKFGPTGQLVYSTYLDGTTFDNPADPIRGGVCYRGQGNGIAADAAGNAYVVGVTSTNDFPTTAGAFLPTKPTTGARCLDFPAGFLTKLSPTGASLVYSTYLDGNGVGKSVAIDGAANAYVGGVSSPPAAPPGTLIASLAGGGETTGNYIARFDATGFPARTTVIAASADSVSVGSDGSVFVAGRVAGGGFAGRLDPGGTAWLWTTVLPGVLRSIAAAPDLSAWVAGHTDANSFPTQNPLRTKTAPTEAVVLKLSPAGSLVFSTPLGAGRAYGIDVDETGDAYVTGHAGTDFLPASPGAYSSPPSGGLDVFVLKLSDAGCSPRCRAAAGPGRRRS